jgi:hypothetical protein
VPLDAKRPFQRRERPILSQAASDDSNAKIIGGVLLGLSASARLPVLT